MVTWSLAPPTEVSRCFLGQRETTAREGGKSEQGREGGKNERVREGGKSERGRKERNEMIKHAFPRRQRGCDCGIIPPLGGSCTSLCTFICGRARSACACAAAWACTCRRAVSAGTAAVWLMLLTDVLVLLSPHFDTPAGGRTRTRARPPACTAGRDPHAAAAAVCFPNPLEAGGKTGPASFLDGQ